jgi:hypothetical protein
MMNEGLEALADMAMAAPASPESTSNNIRQPFNPAFAATSEGVASVHTSPTGSNAVSIESPKSPHAIQNVNVLQALNNTGQWQHQQAMVAAGMNPASMTIPNFALLAGMQQQQQQQADPSALMAMQQMSYYQYFMQNQSSANKLMSMGGRGAIQSNDTQSFVGPHQTLAHSLAGKTQPRAPSNGKCLFYSLIVVGSVGEDVMVNIQYHDGES